MIKLPLLLSFCVFCLFSLSLQAKVKISVDTKLKNVQNGMADWSHEICIDNKGTELTEVRLQFVMAYYAEVEADGSTTNPLSTTEVWSKNVGSIKKNDSTIVTTSELTLPSDKNFVKKHILQGVGVRLWRRGVMIAEYKTKKVKALKWPQVAPKIEKGLHAGVGPWLFLPSPKNDSHKKICFGGLTLGEKATVSLKELKELGGGKHKVLAESFCGYPYSMTFKNFDGCIFSFNKDKLLAAITVSNAELVKLESKKVLGQVSVNEFLKLYGKATKSTLVTNTSNELIDVTTGQGVITLWKKDDAVVKIIWRKNNADTTL